EAAGGSDLDVYTSNLSGVDHAFGRQRVRHSNAEHVTATCEPFSHREKVPEGRMRVRAKPEAGLCFGTGTPWVEMAQACTLSSILPRKGAFFSCRRGGGDGVR